LPFFLGNREVFEHFYGNDDEDDDDEDEDEGGHCCHCCSACNALRPKINLTSSELQHGIDLNQEPSKEFYQKIIALYAATPIYRSKLLHKLASLFNRKDQIIKLSKISQQIFRSTPRNETLELERFIEIFSEHHVVERLLENLPWIFQQKEIDEKENYLMCIQLIGTLCVRSMDHVKNFIFSNVSHSDRYVRESVVWLLKIYRVREPKELEIIKILLRDPDPSIKILAWELIQIGEVSDELVRFLADQYFSSSASEQKIFCESYAEILEATSPETTIHVIKNLGAYFPFDSQSDTMKFACESLFGLFFPELPIEHAETLYEFCLKDLTNSLLNPNKAYVQYLCKVLRNVMKEYDLTKHKFANFWTTVSMCGHNQNTQSIAVLGLLKWATLTLPHLCTRQQLEELTTFRVRLENLKELPSYGNIEFKTMIQCLFSPINHETLPNWEKFVDIYPEFCWKYKRIFLRALLKFVEEGGNLDFDSFRTFVDLIFVDSDRLTYEVPDYVDINWGEAACPLVEFYIEAVPEKEMLYDILAPALDLFIQNETYRGAQLLIDRLGASIVPLYYNENMAEAVKDIVQTHSKQCLISSGFEFRKKSEATMSIREYLRMRKIRTMGVTLKFSGTDILGRAQEFIFCTQSTKAHLYLRIHINGDSEISDVLRILDANLPAVKECSIHWNCASESFISDKTAESLANVISKLYHVKYFEITTPAKFSDIAVRNLGIGVSNNRSLHSFTLGCELSQVQLDTLVSSFEANPVLSNFFLTGVADPSKKLIPKLKQKKLREFNTVGAQAKRLLDTLKSKSLKSSANRAY